MCGNEAETRLREQDCDCCYLTRYDDDRKELTLSVLRNKEDGYIIFQNFNIVREPEDEPSTYEISGSDKKCGSITELLEFYKDNALNHILIDGIGVEIQSKAFIASQKKSLLATVARNGAKNGE